MKIDVLTKEIFTSYEESMSLVIKDIKSHLIQLNNLVMQLQDRLKILESKNQDG